MNKPDSRNLVSTVIPLALVASSRRIDFLLLDIDTDEYDICSGRVANENVAMARAAANLVSERGI